MKTPSDIVDSFSKGLDAITKGYLDSLSPKEREIVEKRLKEGPPSDKGLDAITNGYRVPGRQSPRYPHYITTFAFPLVAAGKAQWPIYDIQIKGQTLSQVEAREGMYQERSPDAEPLELKAVKPTSEANWHLVNTFVEGGIVYWTWVDHGV